ncbi:2'-5' RNA ligase family protein, partial [Shewanella sp. 0m-11]
AKLGLHCSEHSYNPHITLARKAKGEARTVVYHPICLQPLQLHLFESYPGTNGVEYPTLQHWDLA